MDELGPDSEYHVYRNTSPSDGDMEDSAAVVPARYRTTDPNKLAQKQARSQARAEVRRTRRTMRLQQQQQQPPIRQLPIEPQPGEEHYKLTVDEDSTEESSVDENYDVVSITESLHENLT